MGSCQLPRPTALESTRLQHFTVRLGHEIPNGLGDGVEVKRPAFLERSSAFPFWVKRSKTNSAYFPPRSQATHGYILPQMTHGWPRKDSLDIFPDVRV